MRLGYSGSLTISLAIYSDSNGRPGDRLHVLTYDGDLSENIDDFEFSGTGVLLNADTTYWLVNEISPIGSSYTLMYVFATLFEEEDSGSETGWSIGDDRYLNVHLNGEVRTYSASLPKIIQKVSGSNASGTASVSRKLVMEFVEKRSTTTNTAPTISTEAAITASENEVEVDQLEATDDYIPTGGLVWAIRSGTDGGADRDKFLLTPGGLLLFRSPKNFEAKDDANTDAVYEVAVEVRDETNTTTKNLMVTLEDTNEAPSADAGSDQTGIEEGTAVTLAGTGSDPDSGDPVSTLSYRWRQTDGMSEHQVSLRDGNKATASFTAPTRLLDDVTLNFVLTVTDDGGISTDDGMSVAVEARGPLPEEGLIGNLGQASDSSLSIDSRDAAYAQAFTTSPVSTTLDWVRLSMSVPSRTTPKVAIHEDSDGRPGSRLRTLGNPSGLDEDTGTSEEFTTTNLVMQPNSKYWVVVTRASGSGSVVLGATASAAEDANAAANWTIAGGAWQRSGDTWSEVAGSQSIKLAIMGDETPYILNWSVSSRPMTGDTYRAGENLELEFTFNEPVTANRLVRAYIWVGPPQRASSYRRATYAWGSETRKLVLAYKIQERDADDDGFSMDARFLRTDNEARITDLAGAIPANVHLEAAEAGTGHKANGSGEMGCPLMLCATVTAVQHGDAGTHGAGHYDSGNMGNISNRVFHYSEDNYPVDDLAYVLMEVLVRDQGQLEILLNRPPGEVLLSETRLNVGDESFPLRSGVVNGSRITWRSTGLSWAVGDKVSISISDHTVISNLLQSNDGRVSSSSTTPALAQSFETGSHGGGYSLLAARLPISAYALNIPTVSVYSDDGGAPGSKLHDLARPVWFKYGFSTHNDFTASVAKLGADTTYWVVVEKRSGKRDFALPLTEAADEDTGALSGWSLGDAGQERSGGTWTALTGATDTIQLAILAMPANRQATGGPAFVTPPRVGKPVQLDYSGIADDDGLTGVSYAHQWIMDDLRGVSDEIPGATDPTYVPRSEDLGKRLRVRVSFNDDLGNLEVLTSSGSTPVGTLVNNFGQLGTGSPFLDKIVSAGGYQAQQFTTGSQSGGYVLHSVRLKVQGHGLEVSVYSDNNGKPGESLQQLSGPERLHGLELRTEVYTATSLTLQPSTSYWLVLLPRTAVLSVASTYFTEEDEGSAAGWSIGDGRYRWGRYGNSPHAWWVVKSLLDRPISLFRMLLLAE